VALLNPSPVLALPTAMWITFRTLAELGPLTQAELFALTSPPAIRPVTGSDGPAPTSAAREAYRALRDHGMVETDEHGRVTLTAATVKPANYAAFCAAMRSRLLSQPVAEPPLDESGANDLLRGLSWLLMTDPISQSWNEPRAAQECVPAGPALVFVNRTRWNGFRFWAEALGFAEEPTVDVSEGASLVANPTRALRDFVTSTYAPGDDLPLSRLLDDFRAAVPVVPGGAVSRSLGYARDPREVDLATTYALESGRVRGWLTLERRADAADTVLLTGLDKPRSVRAVSDVIIGEVIDV
jgi:hypothetical protein